MGQDIMGTNTGQQTFNGWFVFLNDNGNIIAIGAPGDLLNSNSIPGLY